jgi:hypothetical protein
VLPIPAQQPHAHSPTEKNAVTGHVQEPITAQSCVLQLQIRLRHDVWMFQSFFGILATLTGDDSRLTKRKSERTLRRPDTSRSDSQAELALRRAISRR